MQFSHTQYHQQQHCKLLLCVKLPKNVLLLIILAQIFARHHSKAHQINKLGKQTEQTFLWTRYCGFSSSLTGIASDDARLLADVAESERLL